MIDRPKIILVGDLMLDHYLWGECDRISPEAPVQVVVVNKESVVLGGAGNVLNNLITLGALVDVISVIGDDSVALELKEHLDLCGVSSDHLVIEKKRNTSKKSRIIASNQQIVRFDKESVNDICLESEEALVRFFKENISTSDIVILSDYGKGVLTSSLTPRLIAISNEHKKKILVDPKGTDYSKYSNATLVTPNKKEAMAAVGYSFTTNADIERAGFELRDSLHLEYALITLSEDGIAIFDDHMRTIPTIAQEVFDVTGAGDTVIATLAYRLALGSDIDQATHYANAAAAVVVGKLGSATATHAEIENYLSKKGHTSRVHNIKTFDEIEAIAQNHKGKSIVFTNGCFDILHAGHVSYLEIAKSFGDILIVGVNTDRSVRTLKGETRPVNTQEDRAFILAALHAVDFVVIFDEETPYELIKRIQPDVLVKGGDYHGKEVVGSDIAKEVRLVDFVDGKSTTATIAKIEKGALC